MDHYVNFFVVLDVVFCIFDNLVLVIVFVITCE